MKNILIILGLSFLGTLSLNAQFKYEARKIASEIELDSVTLDKFYEVHKKFSKQYEKALPFAETDEDRDYNYKKTKYGLEVSLKNILSETQYQKYQSLVIREEKELQD